MSDAFSDDFARSLDAILQGLHGFMPLLAALAGIWVWRRYRQAGWGLLGTLALLRWGAGLVRPDLALDARSNLVRWFLLCAATYSGAAAIDRWFPRSKTAPDAARAPNATVAGAANRTAKDPADPPADSSR